jgi:hypothetical protein
MIGKKFHRLTVIEKIDDRNWLCHCDCGNKKVAITRHLERGNVKSCGCFRKEFRKTHGRSTHLAYKVWNQMKQRCNNPKHKAFKYYGGKGVRVCKKWETFEGFVSEMGERPTPLHTIERIDTNGNYDKENCRWATRLEQQQNLSSNRVISWNGKTLTISAWARETGIGMKTIQYRLDAEWDLDKVFTHVPYRKSRTLVSHLGPQ